MRHLRTIILFIVIVVSLHSNAYNIRRISSREGLSNSAVICLFQDKERSLWIGTYDGLNKYDGADISIHKPDIKNPNSLSGNVIRDIVESKDDYLWIMTKGGLNKYSKNKNQVVAYFEEFQEDCSMACDNQGNFFIITQIGSLFYYDFDECVFREIDIPDFKPTRDWISLIIDKGNKVWVTNNGVIKQYKINYPDKQHPTMEQIGIFDHPQRITNIYDDKGVLFFVDSKRDLFVVTSNKKEFIRNIRPAIAEYGNITSILFDNKDIIIGFITSGLVRLNHKKEYDIEKFPINCGVFSLLKDDVQDILWVGTDGQGVYACVQDGYTFKGINLDKLPLKTQRPVRAIFSDHHNYLWLGTKGNGIIKIKDYELAQEYNWQNTEHISTQQGLAGNAVFVFEMSHRNNVLWIGSSGMKLNYYSFSDNKIHTLNCNIPIPEVYGILETSDTTLWVTSLLSLLKISIQKNGNTIEARQVKRYEFDVKNRQRFNKIYSIRQVNDSIMWLAMRGNGAIRFNSRTGDYRLVTFDEKGIVPMNDILSAHIARNKEIWFGSSYGINNLKVLPNNKFQHHNYNENDGLPNNTIHGILEGNNGKLWLSSNTGIILFDPAKETFRNFNQRSGLKVIEFSDNAYYKDEETATYFFGGIDGVVWIRHEEKERNNFVPPIYFTKLRILNEEVNMDDFFVRKKKKEHLRLKHNQNFFTISFSTNDFIEGPSIKFSYMLENFNEVWMNTLSREAQFTNIPPGKYVLRARYDNGSEKESQMASLHIEILPPWYLSIYANILYTILTLCVLFFTFVYFKKRYERKKIKITRKLDQKYKEEMYENKLRFFTNITHEFCTPLTLIQTPSERILNYDGSDSYIKKYAFIIRSNTERLNNLIQEIIDFRRIETGNKVRKIELCPVNEICEEIMNAFADLAEENKIRFRLDIAPAIRWNSDRSCLTTILNNLISNAFKYTTENGLINITILIEDEHLVIKVYNSGKGIRQEDIPYLFNRYSVLDNVEQNTIKGLSSRNGLGLAICKSMVALLDGEIEVESEAGKYAEFIVRLPACEATAAESAPKQWTETPPASGGETPTVSPPVPAPLIDTSATDRSTPQHTASRSTILIVDDNEEILWTLKEILSDDYTVVTAKDGNLGLEQITQCMPDLIITDIMMPHQDGISMTKKIKSNPHTVHIPLVIVSAKSAINDKIEGIESGADAYIAKPFDIQFLKTVVRQLIEKHKKLKDYYNSSASSFNYLSGQLLPKEDRDFIQSVLLVVDQHMEDVDFSPGDLADNLRISLRSLYRKFKELDLPSPKDFIKKQRIEYSAKLLLSTNRTIQEIMYNAGFTTRSHFYKEFAKRYQQSPKEYRENGIAGTETPATNK